MSDKLPENPTLIRPEAVETLDTLVATLYEELREIARRHRRRRDPATSVSTTALVHEAYLKFAGRSSTAWKSRLHFLSVAAIAMRHLLVDRAKARKAAKRGGGDEVISLDDDLILVDDDRGSLLQLDESLTRLAAVDANLSSIVEYRFYGGLTHEEIAELLGVTVRTVERRWAKARLFLLHDMSL
jgi:RNA polymerase sigma factor (TIGR02999 family)